MDHAMNPSLMIVEAALKLAGKLPGDVVEQTAQIISSHEASEARSRIADSIPHPHFAIDHYPHPFRYIPYRLTWADPVIMRTLFRIS